MRGRVARLEQAVLEAVKLASPALQQVINDLQALRGIADISAVTIASELGQVSRFDSARQLMGTAASYQARILVVNERDAEASPRLAMRTCDASLSKPHGAIVVRQVRSAKTTGEHLGRDPRRLHGRRNTGCTSDI